jgi:hypothetical protein
MTYVEVNKTYNSILQLNIVFQSEEKLQDQLTKTMSVVFEGMVELGGASGLLEFLLQQNA